MPISPPRATWHCSHSTDEQTEVHRGQNEPSCWVWLQQASNTELSPKDRHGEGLRTIYPRNNFLPGELERDLSGGLMLVSLGTMGP